MQQAMNGSQAVGQLFDRIDNALSTNPYVPSRRVRFEAAEGSVVLQGNVGSFFEKQMAQEALRRVDGIHRIDNRLKVTWA